jgi:hypothetical protein
LLLKIEEVIFRKRKTVLDSANKSTQVTHSVKVLTVKCTKFLIFNALLKTSVSPFISLVGNKQNLTHPQENPFAV